LQKLRLISHIFARVWLPEGTITNIFFWEGAGGKGKGMGAAVPLPLLAPPMARSDDETWKTRDVTSQSIL